ncbi:MAG: ABC transporter ATP-binding protein [candidate division WOR-3 bacterium]
MLKVEKINVFYDEVQVLWDLSLEVKQGEIVSIVGPNGAGKTTLLKTISGLIRPKTGLIMFLNERIDGLIPHKIVERGIVQVPEGRRLFPFMTVQENLEMGAYTRRAREKLKESLEFVYQLFPALKERRNQLAATLSGGEQQMLAIGRALMSQPKLLLIDEPTFGLAPKIIADVIEVVRKLNEKGTTVLLAEQNIQCALELSDRIYIIETGKVALNKPPSELMEMESVRQWYLGL